MVPRSSPASPDPKSKIVLFLDEKNIENDKRSVYDTCQSSPPLKDQIQSLFINKIKNTEYGEANKIGITTSQKTSITLTVYTLNNIEIGEPLSCTPTADFKCEILWTIPKDIVPGQYIISVNDSKIIVEKTFEIK